MVTSPGSFTVVYLAPIHRNLHLGGKAIHNHPGYKVPESTVPSFIPSLSLFQVLIRIISSQFQPIIPSLSRLPFGNNIHYNASLSTEGSSPEESRKMSGFVA